MMEYAPEEQKEFIRYDYDPTQRLATIYQRLYRAQELLAENTEETDLRNEHEVLHGFMRGEYEYFSKFRGLQFDYMSAEDNDKNLENVIQNAIFKNLAYEVGVNEREECVVYAGVYYLMERSRNAPRQLLVLRPGDILHFDSYPSLLGSLQIN